MKYEEGLKAQMGRRLVEAQARAEMNVGWVHDVWPHSEYGMPGAALPVSWLGTDAKVTVKILWIPVDGMSDLLAVLDKIRSDAFTQEMAELERPAT